MRYFEISKSEQHAKELLSAISRLEKKFPELKKVNSGVRAVRSRFEAICKEVRPEKLDRRGSLIGGMLFTSKKFPEPKFDRGGRPEARMSCAGLAPLAQLDLDQISDCIGESVGSGLLQVWMKPGDWGWTQECFLGALEIRLVPRHVVDRTEVLLESSVEEDVEWIEKKAAELEALKSDNPKRAEKEHEVYQEHYFSGANGLDWTLSLFSDYKKWNSPGRFGAPQQITGWRPAGYTIPPSSAEPSIWDLPDYFDDRFPGLDKDPDYKIICEILKERRERPICALFDIYNDFHTCLYGSEVYVGKASVGWNWRPLFAFRGPLSDRVDDEHVIFYRETDDGFEYAGASMRWNWH